MKGLFLVTSILAALSSTVTVAVAGPSDDRAKVTITGQKAAPTEMQILEDKYTKPLEEIDLVGRTFVVSAPGRWERVLKFGIDTVQVVSSTGAAEMKLNTEGNKLCLSRDCYRAYRLADGRYVAFDVHGIFMGWMTLAKVKTSPTETQILDDKSAKPVEQADLVGKTFFLSAPGRPDRVLKFGANTVQIVGSAGTTQTKLSTDGNKHCLNRSCYRTYRLQDGRYVTFDTGGAFMGWMLQAN